MGLQSIFGNLKSATEKMQNFCNKEIKGETTIMHSEVYSTEEEAKKANENPSFRALYSSKKEFSRRMRGI